jgi:hypothetical protein
MKDRRHYDPYFHYTGPRKRKWIERRDLSRPWPRWCYTPATVPAIFNLIASTLKSLGAKDAPKQRQGFSKN